MNFVISLIQLFFVALLYMSAVKTAHIPKEGGKNTNDVVPFMEVYNKSMCQTREVLVDIFQEYPDEIEHIFIPSCVVLMRCAGCCNDEALECVPTETYNVTMEVKIFKHLKQKNNFLLSFTEHRRCECRPKKEVKERKEKKPRRGKGKGLKRKRRKNKEKKHPSHCEPCSERRKRLFVQDPLTCQCSCKHSESDCKSRQLELNERTCRCDKPRR
ncbi:vascular endothelial growth factor Ab isoform X2 [Megalops cyprinoides]|uniref:vascular endothelial growth factor Ab isoform X2 n=1 Tax=Megalops cyprinoides TaxID=118141 RepID=UPI001863DD16|nr:vascular endothelial growth factor Ab isoform X2 [Megalops cyprinoides]